MAITGYTNPKWSTVCLLSLLSSTTAFAPSPLTPPTAPRIPLSLRAHKDTSSSPQLPAALQSFATTAAALTLLALPLTTPIAHADEWGKETEAPTLFTGETVMICKKRGPLGACIETAVRTAQNDNDKSLEYFRDPSEEVKRRRAESLRGSMEEEEGNELIARLRRQSVENRERNEEEVRVKTFMNDQAASFGPFDRQVVILNTDKKTFTLLENPQAMRLKKAGYIDNDRKFIIQPSQEVIDEALEGKNLGEAIMGIFGGGSSSNNKAEIELDAASSDVDVASVESAESGDAVVSDETTAE